MGEVNNPAGGARGGGGVRGVGNLGRIEHLRNLTSQSLIIILDILNRLGISTHFDVLKLNMQSKLKSTGAKGKTQIIINHTEV